MAAWMLVPAPSPWWRTMDSALPSANQAGALGEANQRNSRSLGRPCWPELGGVGLAGVELGRSPSPRRRPAPRWRPCCRGWSRPVAPGRRQCRPRAESETRCEYLLGGAHVGQGEGSHHEEERARRPGRTSRGQEIDRAVGPANAHEAGLGRKEGVKQRQRRPPRGRPTAPRVDELWVRAYQTVTRRLKVNHSSQQEQQDHEGQIDPQWLAMAVAGRQPARPSSWPPSRSFRGRCDVALGRIAQVGGQLDQCHVLRSPGGAVKVWMPTSEAKKVAWPSRQRRLRQRRWGCVTSTLGRRRCRPWARGPGARWCRW